MCLTLSAWLKASVMGVVGAVVGIWFQFPPSWRSDTTFRKKVKFLLLAQMFILVMSLQYWVFSWTFYVVPLQYQWILAFILIFAREINNLVMAAICDKGASFKTTNCYNNFKTAQPNKLVS